MMSRRVWLPRAYGLLSALGCLGLAAALAPVGRDPADPLHVVLPTLGAGLGVALVGAAAVYAFRKADEFAQQGSRVGWYWGGLLGLAASLPVYVFLAQGGSHWLSTDFLTGPDARRAFLIGFLIPVILQIVFSGLALTAWRASKR